MMGGQEKKLIQRVRNRSRELVSHWAYLRRLGCAWYILGGLLASLFVSKLNRFQVHCLFTPLHYCRTLFLCPTWYSFFFGARDQYPHVGFFINQHKCTEDLISLISQILAVSNVNSPMELNVKFCNEMVLCHNVVWWAMMPRYRHGDEKRRFNTLASKI